MRRTIPFAVTVLAAIMAVLAVMVGVASGVISGQAGPPTQVFMQTTDGDVDEVCLVATLENQSAMHQDLHLDAGSSVVALFSFELHELNVREQGELGIVLTGGGDPGHRFVSGVWRFPGNANFHKASGTVSWSFADVPATGDWTVDVRALVGPLDEPTQQVHDAAMDSCSLTLFVSPPAA
jgi:hypothetical protein